ncbi:MAG: 6-carboxytetrahydropterin synthase [Ruminococcus sp.]|nr:6-carboxytetrahydropterin synthase [Ruminococcus sp.]
MYVLKTSAAFDSAHFLAGYKGKCKNIHGHRWRIEAEISSEDLIASGQQRGMVADFGDFKRDLRALAEEFDHALIYEKGTLRSATVQALNEEDFRLIEVDFRPTAENFAEYFHGRLSQMGYSVVCVTVYETPDNCAAFTD